MGRGRSNPAFGDCDTVGTTSGPKHAPDHGDLVSDLRMSLNGFFIYPYAEITCCSGCGPLGLLILAVAKAYGVKKIVMFDIEESRTKFSQSYGADAGIVTARNDDPSKDSLAFSQEYAKEIITDYDVGSGFDVAVEASGAEICAQMAVCMLKQGGTCS